MAAVVAAMENPGVQLGLGVLGEVLVSCAHDTDCHQHESKTIRFVSRALSRQRRFSCERISTLLSCWGYCSCIKHMLLAPCQG